MAQRRIILLLSGEIAAGKTTLSEHLSRNFDFKVLKTRESLTEIGLKRFKGKNKQPDRTYFQQLGEQLDNSEDGRWVLDAFQEKYNEIFEKHNFFVIDSVRILRQIQHFRSAYSLNVFHIHLTASQKSLESRYLKRAEVKDLIELEANQKYLKAKSDSTEKKVHELSDDADLVINTDLCTKDDILVRVASFFNLLAPTKNELVDVIIGGQFGSEGKGHIAAHIAPQYDCLVRIGGPNAGHTVYEEPKNHVFHLLPSGTWRNQNATIVLGPGTVIHEIQLAEEISKYLNQDEFSKGRLIIDENAIIISQKDIDEEQKLIKYIGSTGQGVGFATANNLLARLMGEDSHKAKHSKILRPYLGNTGEVLEKMYKENRRILLEGTQGSGLSLHHGLYPHVTSRDTTVSGCLSEAGISPKRVRKIIMVTRRYPIRVAGTSGPFLSSEITKEIVSQRSGKKLEIIQSTEITTTTKKERRIAEFSWTLFRRACELNSPSDIALTFADYISITNEKARRYDQLTPNTQQFVDELERCSGVKVSLIGTGFDYRGIIDRRNWR